MAMTEKDIWNIDDEQVFIRNVESIGVKKGERVFDAFSVEAIVQPAGYSHGVQTKCIITADEEADDVRTALLVNATNPQRED